MSFKVLGSGLFCWKATICVSQPSMQPAHNSHKLKAPLCRGNHNAECYVEILFIIIITFLFKMSSLYNAATLILISSWWNISAKYGQFWNSNCLLISYLPLIVVIIFVFEKHKLSCNINCLVCLNWGLHVKLPCLIKEEVVPHAKLHYYFF